MLRRATALKRICDRQRVQNAIFPINNLHERKTMIKREKNTIGIVKDVICKVAPKKQLQTVLALCMNLKNQSALRKD